MNQISSPESEITWMPLKEAAGLLGCSVKTIRRRISAGAWRSMIEYQGQKAIRLVCREDVLQESATLSKAPSDSVQNTLAIQALDGLPRQLGEVLQTYLAGLQEEVDHSARRSRLLLLVSVGLTAILLTGIGFHFRTRREEILEFRLREMSRTLSTTLLRSHWILGKEAVEARNRAAETQILAQEAHNRALAQDQRLTALAAALQELADGTQAARSDPYADRKQLSALRRQVARLEQAVAAQETVRPDSPGIPAADAEESVGPGADPAAENPSLAPEKKRSRFLGIF